MHNPGWWLAICLLCLVTVPTNAQNMDITWRLSTYQTSAANVTMYMRFRLTTPIPANGFLDVSTSGTTSTPPDGGARTPARIICDDIGGPYTAIPSCETLSFPTSYDEIGPYRIKFPNGLAAGVEYGFALGGMYNQVNEGTSYPLLAWTTDASSTRLELSYNTANTFTYATFYGEMRLSSYQGGVTPVTLTVYFYPGQAVTTPSFIYVDLSFVSGTGALDCATLWDGGSTALPGCTAGDLTVNGNPYTIATNNLVTGTKYSFSITGLSNEATSGLSHTQDLRLLEGDGTTIFNYYTVAAWSLTDTQAPAISGCPSDISVNTAPGLSTAVVSWVAPTATDNLGVTSFTPNFAPGSTFSVGTTTVTYTALDASFNSDTCSFNVIVTDDQQPIFTCPSAITVNTDVDLPTAVVSWTQPVATDNVDTNPTVTASPASGSVFSLGATTVTYTVSDAASNTYTCSFVVTVLDNQNPVVTCPADQTINTDPGSATGVATWSNPGYSDNVPGLAAPTSTHASGTAFSIGTTTVTYTVTDLSSNTGTCSFTVTVIDNESPTVVCPADIASSTDAGSATKVVTWSPPTAADNALTVTVTSDISPGTAFAIGTTTVTYTVTDAALNTVSCQFTVTITDTELPVLTCPANIALNTDSGSPTAIVTWAAATSTDNVAVTSGPTPDFTPGSAFGVGTHTVTYSASDAAGNVGTCSFTIAVTDIELPVLVCPSDITVNTAPTLSTQTVTWTTPSPTDNTAVSSLVASKNPGTVFNLGPTVVTYTATDLHGNVQTCTFTVTVLDNEAPVIPCPADIAQNTDPGSSGAVVSWTVPTATDNVGTVTSLTSTHPLGATFSPGTTVVTYSIADAAGNTGTCSFNVVITDNEDPTISCPASFTQSTDPTVATAVVSWVVPVGTDNVGVVTTEVYPQAPGTSFTLGATTVTYTVRDAAGNSATCSFVVTVQDTEPPVISCPSDLVFPTAPGVSTRAVSWTAPRNNFEVTDNQGVLTILPDIAPGSTFALGINTVTYEATDLDGNTATCTFTVTILDQEPPVLTCPSDILQPTDPGIATANVSWTPPSFTDNVDTTVTTSASYASGALFYLGKTNVTYTATDSAGNSASCYWTINVVDFEPPVVSCPPGVFILLDLSQASSPAYWATPTATDNDAVVSLSSPAASGEVFPVGNTEVVYTAFDPSGNNGTCSFLITISDFLPNVTLDDHRTGASGTTVTVHLRPQYRLPPLGTIEITLPAFTGTASLVCSGGTGEALPGCVDGPNVVTGTTSFYQNGGGLPYIIRLGSSSALTPRVIYSFSISGLTNPPTPGRTADLSVATKDTTGYVYDINSHTPPLEIMSVLLSTTTLSIPEGSSSFFTVTLDTFPTSPKTPVTVRFNTSRATEVVVVPQEVTFNVQDYNVTQTVMVYALTDLIDDGDQTVTVASTIVTEDSEWYGLPVDDVVVTVLDVDTSGVTINPVTVTTSEKGGVATFSVVLDSKPTSAVTILVASANSAENSVSPSSLVFQPLQWDVPQSVTVTGIEDQHADGHQVTGITLSPVSADPNYNGMVLTVSATNTDDDTAGILLYPTNGTTYENSLIRSVAYFHAKLQSKPFSTVTLAIVSDDLTEGTVFPSTLTFTTSNWNTLQRFEVRSVDDQIEDGDITYQVTLTATSTDTVYNGMTASVSVLNMDSDHAGLEFLPDIRTHTFSTYESQLPLEYKGELLEFWFHTAPTAPVTVVFTTSDVEQGYASPDRITVTPAEYAQRNFSTRIIGNDDVVNDHNTPFTLLVTFETADPSYLAKNYTIKGVNFAHRYKDMRKSTALFSVCVTEDVYSFSKDNFLQQAATAFNVTEEEVNVDSIRACTTTDEEGMSYTEETWTKFKPQALTGGTRVWFQLTGQLPTGTETIETLEAAILNQLNTDSYTRYLLHATGIATMVRAYRERNEITYACPPTLRRYFGVTLKLGVGTTFDTASTPFSPVSPVVWAVHNIKNTNPIWRTNRYASDPVLHPFDGLKTFAETGETKALLSELAERKERGHLESYGVAYTDPSNPSVVMKGQTVHIGFYASPGDYLNLATQLSRSNDRFYGNDEFGFALFDDKCQPQWMTEMDMFLYDAGTAKNQPFWANLHLGRDSRQYNGGSYGLGQVAQTELTRLVPESELLNPDDIYPLGRNLLHVGTERGLDVDLYPLVNSYHGANATIELSLPFAYGLGNELRVEFPHRYFEFNHGSPTSTEVLGGLDSMEKMPETLVDENIVTIRFSSDIVISSRLVTLRLTGLVLPPVCGELPYRVTTHNCSTFDPFASGIHEARTCSPAIVDVTSVPPNGMPRGCDPCNTCTYSLRERGEDWFTCWAETGASFLRIGPLDTKCAANPYTLEGYPFNP